ncbi:ATP-dependent helicase [Candidatus Peregrinibacteria bacterium]|nr:ATP-dependent helicase [Candidatus Peregrinibacteria bacterium]
MLNSEQQKAISHREGPLLIIAGAGTGKTKVIVAKILHLIKEQDVSPKSILALTFAEKAANEMVERIDAEMPIGYEELCVKTFHAFADFILREAGMEIGLDPGYKVLSPVEQWFFFKKNLFNFELDYYRPLGNPNRFIYDLLNHFSKLKDELIAPEKYLDFAMKMEGEEGVKMVEIAKAYKRYQELMVKNNYMDFGDLCFYANKLLDQRDSVLKKYQDRFKYILIDEFQDTNYAQFQLVLKLAGQSRNITVVGDDDQSIYKWRGASLSNIIQFEKIFFDAEKIVLKENYRSSQNILDAAYSLIQNNNPDRLEAKSGIDKRLKADAGVGEDVEVHQFPDFLQESSFVAEQIKELRRDGLKFSDFAVLVRNNAHAHPFIDELKHLGIPYQVRNPKGLFSLEEIKDLIAVVRFLANPSDDISLLRVLKMDVFGIKMVQILHILNQDKKLFHAARGELGLGVIVELLGDLIEFSKKNSVGMVINRFLKKSLYLENLIKGEKYQELENINEFARQIAKFEKENPENTVLDFVSYLDLLEEAGAVFETGEFEDQDGVQILTAHGSKGLEFEYVFIVNAVNQRFPGSRRGEVFEIPKEITNEIYPDGDFHVQEERRLFYVAMTRAKKKLFVSYSHQYEGNKKWKRSQFVEEILKDGKARLVEHKEETDAITRLKDFKKPEKPIFDLPKFDLKKLSYTQFDVFKTCPLKYNYTYLMKVPVPSFHAQNFGTSVHQTLNQFYKILKRGESVSLALLKDIYERNWLPHGYESMEHEKTRREEGWKMLRTFFKENSEPWVVPAFLEQPFNIKVGSYMVSGRIDRIDKIGNGIFEVIDYKTGRKKDDDLAKNLQLSIYALACRDVLKIKADKLSLYFIEDNEKVSTTRTDKQLDQVESEVLSIIQEMERSKFEPKPGHYCQFCNFRIICPAV